MQIPSRSSSRRPLPTLARLAGAGALSLAGLCSCAAEPADAGSAPLARQIETLIGDAACDSAAQCRTVAVGAKPCGGPEAYLAWSTRRTDEPQLKAAVLRHAERRRAENVAAGLASNCMMVTDPGASCRAGRCSLNPPGMGPAASSPY